MERRDPAGPRERVQFRPDAGLRLSRPAERVHAGRPGDRSHLSQPHRMARHPPAPPHARRRCCKRRSSGFTGRKAPVHLVGHRRRAAAATCWKRSSAMPRYASTAELRDFEPRIWTRARRSRESLGLDGVRFVQGDAFDRAALGLNPPRPTWPSCPDSTSCSPDNDACCASLQGLADAMPAGGALIYTNQPWHPQLELIARGLCDWDGKPWVMRRRTQAEMDDLVQAAGFEKEQTEIDRWGIFSVSLARRVGPERGSDVAVALGALRRRVRDDELAGVASRGRGHLVLQLGARPSVRAVADRPLHGHRSVFRCGAFPLHGCSGASSVSAADDAGDCGGGCGLRVHAAAFCFPSS